MRARGAYLSFTEVTDPGAHRAYNEWHQLDHLPEQHTLSGVIHGQRWVCTPDCRSARVAAVAPLDAIHYVTMYALDAPVASSVDQIERLARELRDAGRFFDARRSHLAGAFDIVGGAVAPRLQLSADAVAARPSRGIYVVVRRDRSSGFVDERALLACAGVAGIWTLRSRPGASDHGPAPGLEVQIVFLDQPVVAVADELGALVVGADALDHAGVFERIEPWRWDWFTDGE